MSPKQQKNLAEVRKPQSQTPETTPTNLYKDKRQGGVAVSSHSQAQLAMLLALV